MSYSNLLFSAVILPLSILFLFFDRSTEYKNLVLCITSLLFWAWGKSFGVLILFLSIIIDFFLALAAEGSGAKTPKATVFMVIDFLWNAFLFLLFTKNSSFSSDGLLHLRNALIPVGVAFYTLKNLSYVYDVYSGRIKAERNIFCLFTYSVSYPFLLAGPVLRYGDIEPQIRKREVTSQKLSNGITRFAIGFAKTILVLPVLERLYEAGLDKGEPTLAGAWLGMIAFFGAGFFAFTGLSDMGTGIAQMNGFDVGVNYQSITAKGMLSGLVKSYNTSMVSFFEDIRSDFAAPAVATVLLSVLGGCFYAQHRFVLVFALIIGILLAAEHIASKDKIEHLPYLIKLAVVFILSMLLFSSFAFESFSDWASWFKSLFGVGNLYTLSTSVKYTIINNCWLLLIALIGVNPLGRTILAKLDTLGESSTKAYTRVRTLKTVCTALLLAACYIVLAAQTVA
ncbi:MAG: hypothetical protein LUI06_09175 [Ruminococcus sp.]|nr:hypothetical protein [Ruminococcus sp.]